MLGCGARMRSKPHSCHDPQRALRPDEQLVEVGADGSGRGAAGAHDAAVGEHDLEADDEVLDLAVARRVLAGAATGDPAADRGQVEALREVADAQVVTGEFGLEVGSERAGGDLDDARLSIDVADAAQPGDVEQHAAERRNGATRDAAAAGDDRQRDALAVADRGDRGDLLRGRRSADRGSTARHVAGQRPVQSERPPVPRRCGRRFVVVVTMGRSRRARRGLSRRRRRRTASGRRSR